MTRTFRLFLTLAGALLALDQVVKWWAREAADWTESRSIWAMWPGVFELRLVYNKGIAFGMMQGGGVFLTPIAIAITAAAAWYSWKHPREPRITHVTMALLASGAIGNLIDRVWLGKVTDMFWIRIINFPVFNVADVCITAAGVLLALGAVKELVKPKSADEVPAESAKPNGPATS